MKVTLITVTYGKRFELLAKVIDSAIKQNIDKVVVIDNGSSESLSEILKSKYGDKVIIYRLEENSGSAMGFKLGIMKALDTESEYFLILDDDNFLDYGTLDLLKDKYNSFKDKCNDKVILQCKRVPYECESSELFPLVNSSFMKYSFVGFCVTMIPKKILKKITSLLKIKTNNAWIDVNRCMYGGMFFHRKLIADIGLPEEKFYLYYDDYEFTYRSYLHGYKIYIINDAIVKDMDGRWDMNDKKQKSFIFTGRIMSDNYNRLYYTVRNAAYFESEISQNRNFLITKVNKYMYMAFLYSYALFKGRLRSFFVIKEAIRDGEGGVMGVNKKYKII